MLQAENQKKKVYDLEERTAAFGAAIITLCRQIKYDRISDPLITQIIRSATSIGANYMEANGASSKKDFTNKIYICKKEAQETKHWLRMLIVAHPEKKLEIDILHTEAKELTLIFQKIVTSARNNH